MKKFSIFFGLCFLLSLFALQTAEADQVFTTDLIIQADVCLGGTNCADGMSFSTNVGNGDLWISSFDPQIHFDDASSTTDDHFSIEVDGGEFNIYNENTPTRIMGIHHNADADSIFIGASGNIGLFNSSPTSNVELSVWAQSGSVAEIRLEDNSQAWDLELDSGDDFKIQDVTGGTAPFEILNGAPTGSLLIDSTGVVNMTAGTASWSGTESLGDGLVNTMKLVANNADLAKVSDVGFQLQNAKIGFLWNFRTAEGSRGFIATKQGTGGPEFELKNTTSSYTNATLHLGSGAFTNTSGQWINASSREYKENIKALESKEALEAFNNLEPVTFTFKRDENKKTSVGFIAEDVPELVATEGRKGMNPLEVVALLTKVVQEQQKVNDEQQKTISDLKEQNQTILGKMNELEKELKLKKSMAMAGEVQ